MTRSDWILGLWIVAMWVLAPVLLDALVTLIETNR